jgi:capsular exopolysaccharide synthesis family protein
MMAMIPRRAKSGDRAELVTVADPHSASAEAYRTLRTSVDFALLAAGSDNPNPGGGEESGPDGDASVLAPPPASVKPKTVLVTSAAPADGKTTTATNLGVAFAQGGRKTLVLDLDFRRPRVHEIFGQRNGAGFTGVILDHSLDDCVVPIAEIPRLTMLSTGRVPPDPAAVLGSKRAARVLQAAKQLADIVVIDSPPILPVSDARVLAQQVDGVVVVCRAGRVSRRNAARATEILRAGGAPLLGCILNDVSRRDAGYAYVYEYSYYRHDGPDGGPRSRGGGRADGAEADEASSSRRWVRVSRR